MSHEHLEGASEKERNELYGRDFFEPKKKAVAKKMNPKKFNTFVGKDAKQMAAESNAYNKRHGIKGKYHAK